MGVILTCLMLVRYLIINLFIVYVTCIFIKNIDYSIFQNYIMFQYTIEKNQLWPVLER